MNPDRICEKYAPRPPKLNISIKDNLIVVRGNKRALKFLSELISAQADSKGDCGFGIGPQMAGNIFFNKRTENGLYIHLEGKCKRDQKEENKFHTPLSP